MDEIDFSSKDLVQLILDQFLAEISLPGPDDNGKVTLSYSLSNSSTSTLLFKFQIKETTKTPNHGRYVKDQLKT